MIKIVLMIWVFSTMLFGGYSRDANGIVTDTNTQLQWFKYEDIKGFRWQEAINICEDLVKGDYDDWRLPNVRELNSIVDYSRGYPAIDPIFDIGSLIFWTSTTHRGFKAWTVDFFWGHQSVEDKRKTKSVVCVRGGL